MSARSRECIMKGLGIFLQCHALNKMLPRRRFFQYSQQQKKPLVYIYTFRWAGTANVKTKECRAQN